MIVLLIGLEKWKALVERRSCCQELPWFKNRSGEKLQLQFLRRRTELWVKVAFLSLSCDCYFPVVPFVALLAIPAKGAGPVLDDSCTKCVRLHW